MTSSVPCSIILGQNRAGDNACIDLPELLATRLLVQGNSGSGKSHLLRRLLEQTASLVQQVVVDPEGDFTTLADKYGHLVINADQQTEAGLQAAGERVRMHRVSAVLNLESADLEGQLRAVGAFLTGMFETARAHWYPVLVVVDEAQLFAPTVGGDTSDETRRLSLNAMTNLMCRGRKRGMAGIIATQRLAKLAKNVAAEASNFLMGRTFLDIDMARAADLLGMERRAAETFRDLARGQFMALGPALCRRPHAITIGPVETASHAHGPLLMPLEHPVLPAEELHDLILQPVANTPPRSRRETSSVLACQNGNDLIAQLDAYGAKQVAEELQARQNDSANATPAQLWTIVQEIAEEDGADYRPLATLYQDFQLRARLAGLSRHVLDMAAFCHMLGTVRSGIDPERAETDTWRDIQQRASNLPEDVRGIFLLLARTAWDSAPCPEDATLARAYGTHSPSRARRQLAFLEECGVIVMLNEGQHRRVAIVGPGWQTA